MNKKSVFLVAVFFLLIQLFSVQKVNASVSLLPTNGLTTPVLSDFNNGFYTVSYTILSTSTEAKKPIPIVLGSPFTLQFSGPSNEISPFSKFTYDIEGISKGTSTFTNSFDPGHITLNDGLTCDTNSSIFVPDTPPAPAQRSGESDENFLQRESDWRKTVVWRHYVPNIHNTLCPSLPLSATFPNSISSTTRMIEEDRLIDIVDKKQKVAVTVKNVVPEGSSTPISSATVDVPATNCVKLSSGDGPINIIFLRGKKWENDNKTFVDEVNNIIKSFNKIQPYSSYADRISYYIDLKKYDEDSFKDDISNSSEPAGSSIIDKISSCSGVATPSKYANNYIMIGSPMDYLGVTGFALIGENISFVKINAVFTIIDEIIGFNNDYVPPTAVHEFSHAFVGLLDEYIVRDLGDLMPSSKVIPTISSENCTSKPLIDYRNSFDNKIYGATNLVGCSYLSKGLVLKPSDTVYYRPSSKSIMNNVGNNSSDSKFNIISCGYVIAAIKGEVIDKKHAQKYWPECLAMNGIEKSGIPVKNSTAPTLSPVLIPPSVKVGSTLTVSGSNFTADNNTVQFSSTDDKSITPSMSAIALNGFMNSFGKFLSADVIGSMDTPSYENTVSISSQTFESYTGENPPFYEIGNISSPTGSYISFAIPPGLPCGSYMMKAGAFNSDWGNSVPIKVSTCREIPTPVVVATSTATSSLITATSTLPTLATSTPPRVSTSTPPVISTSTPVLTLPKVTLTADPQIVSYYGQQSKLTWTASNVTNCTGTGSEYGKTWGESFSGPLPVSGSRTIGIQTQAVIFSITCSGSKGSATASVKVTMQTYAGGGGGGGGSYTPTPTPTTNSTPVPTLAPTPTPTTAPVYTPTTTPTPPPTPNVESRETSHSFLANIFDSMVRAMGF
ncbi:MAG: hypothetical protein NTV72_01185 [Candidatus Taylorbacteria bacterium]|nr:hypothetical protein [Candidatus Taylorbacteria bacterium]